MAQQKVASWYWIVTAALTPFVLIATMVWAFYANEVQTNRAEGQRLVSKLESDHAQLEPLLAHMKDTASLTVGNEIGGPLGSVDQVTDSVTRPGYFSGGESTQPPEKQSPLLRAYLDAKSRFYGPAGDPGYVHEYVAARKWLGEFETVLKRFIALKKTQYYTVETINIGGETAVVSGDLTRALDTASGAYAPPEDALRSALANDAATEPADSTMRKPTRVNLELIYRKQMQLIRDLVAANHHQYALLLSGVSGQVQGEGGDRYWVGYEGEVKRKEAWVSELNNKKTEIDEIADGSGDALDEASQFANDTNSEASAKVISLQQMVNAAEGRIDNLQSRFESEKQAHQDDAENYDEMIRNLPSIKSPIQLEVGVEDGEITYSDYSRGVCHIDLGNADGVVSGQRFEIWRLHGFDEDEFVGVVEIVRTLNAHFSLCTVLTLTDETGPVRKGDILVNHFWHDGEFRTVALHGTFEPPNEAYSKARLTKLLEQQGVTVVDKVQPGVDLVILGSRLLGDEWYRKARSDLRFETLKENDVRLYVDPR